MIKTQNLFDLETSYVDKESKSITPIPAHLISENNMMKVFENDFRKVGFFPGQSQSGKLKKSPQQICNSIELMLNTIRLPRKKKKVLKKFSIELYNALYTNKETTIFDKTIVRFDNVGNISNKYKCFVITEILKLQQMSMLMK